MKHTVTCVCGQDVSVDADSREAAVPMMVKAMDEHVASAPHPQVPGDLTEEQKNGMVQEQMKSEE